VERTVRAGYRLLSLAALRDALVAAGVHVVTLSSWGEPSVDPPARLLPNPTLKILPALLNEPCTLAGVRFGPAAPRV